jgi:TolB protein
LRARCAEGEDRHVRRLLPISCALAAGAALAAGLAAAAPGDTTLISAGADATASTASAVSADGRYVAFTSASALTGVPTGGVEQLYVRDRATGGLALASSSASGTPANGPVDADDVGDVQFALSGDGRYAVFASTATDLTPADADAARDVFRKDLQTGRVTLISVATGGAKANAGVQGDPDVSADGDRVSFGTLAATNLFPGDTNNASDIVVRDVDAGTTTLAAQSTAGVLANGTTERSAISADGGTVVFTAPNGTTNLLPDDTGGGSDTIVRDLDLGTTAAASDPTIPNGISNFPDVSGDGRYVVFETGDKYDPTNDVSGGNDVYRRDMATSAITLISARDGSDTGGNGGGIRPAISADGSRVSFTSPSTDLVAGDANGVGDVFTRDVATTATRLVSSSSAGAQDGTESDRSAIAGGGALTTFVHSEGATPLVAGDTDAQPDVLAKEQTPTDTTPPSLVVSSPVEGSSESTAAVTVSGSASDPSGVAWVTVAGTRVRPAADGGFRAPAALAPGLTGIVVRAMDGSGNVATVTRTVRRAGPGGGAGPALPPRITGLRAGVSRRRLVIHISLSATARLRFRAYRRTVVKRPRHRRVIVVRAVGPLTRRTLRAGTRNVIIRLPSRRPGRYLLRARIITPTRVITRTTSYLVRARVSSASHR